MRFSATVLFPQRTRAAAPGTAPARCVRMGPGQVHTHSSSYIWSWSLALNSPDFQKTESAAKTTRAREQTQLTEKVSRDMDCVPLNASLKITHKNPWTTSAANFVLPFTTTFICAHSNIWTGSYHSTGIHLTHSILLCFSEHFLILQA